MKLIDELENQLEDLADDFIDKHKSLGMKATGDWIDSVEVIMDSTGGKVWANDYTEWLVQGSRPKKNASREEKIAWARWAGATFIGDWVKAKGLSLNPYAVAMVIVEKGTTWYQQGGSDLIDGVNTPERQDQILESVGLALQSQVNEALVRAIQKAAV